ncbi:hypothetical protein [Ascidiimonas aurantiaca]|uniref:hypothetical protein n=1 Tax=Ascidiimonas aurantiaca TaxID=1685432 RepID=UPI0030ECC52A
MEIEDLNKRVDEYKASLATVVDKKLLWRSSVKDKISMTLRAVAARYDIGWRVQELSWLYNNEAVNIGFDSFPTAISEKADLIPSYQFMKGGALVFSQSYSGDIEVFLLFPDFKNNSSGQSSLEMGIYTPVDITEDLILEKVDGFLKEMIKWELPALKDKVGFMN